MKFRNARVTGVVAVVLTTALFVFAANGGSVSGVVEDPDGFPIPNAQVQLSDVSGAVVSNAVSDASGRFTAAVPLGRYTLTAKAEGFKQATIPVESAPAGAPSLRVEMRIAVAQQELTVTAETLDPIAADGSVSALQVDKDLLKSLPVKDDNPLAAAALFLDPAAVGSEGVTVVVDGVESNDLDVPSSSVKKVFVNKNPYSPEFSRPGKGRIEVTTRPGSLQRIHRRIFFSYRNSDFDARNAFAKAKPDMKRMLAEGELDGPLPGKKGSFYLGGDYLRDNQNAFIRAVTPDGVLSESIATPQRAGHFLARTSWQLNPIHTFTVRYSLRADSRHNQGAGGFDLSDRAYDSEQLSQEIRIAETANFSANLTNDVQFAFKHRTSDITSVSNAPATIVLGAFASGGAQTSQNLRENKLELQDVLSVVRGKHMFRFGVGVKRREIDIRDLSNFAGTFTFSSLTDYLAGRPVLFTRNSGNPAASVSYMEYSWFVQDEMRVRKDLGLMLGVRHEWQSTLAGHGNVAPRIAISYAPGSAHTVLRLGAGLFYQREPWSMLQASTLLDGNHVQQIVISNPVVPLPVDLSTTLAAPSVDRIASNLRAPYGFQTSAAIERKFGKRTFMSVEYTRARGGRLFRMRDLNAPLPATGLRPNSNYTNIFQFESTGSSSNNSVSMTFRTTVKRLELLAQYTVSRSMDDTSGAFSLPANSFDVRSEWARSDYDRRHRLTFAAITRLPGQFKLGVLGSWASSMPLNVVTGADNNRDGVVNDRPLGVPRNSGIGPGYANVDLRLSKRINFVRRDENHGRSPYAEVRLDAFNVLNAVNAKSYVGTITSPLFGHANTALPARQLQASIKVSF